MRPLGTENQDDRYKPIISIIILNVNSLNIQIEKQIIRLD